MKTNVCVRPLFRVEVLRVGLSEWQPAGDIETYDVASRYAEGIMRDMRGLSPTARLIRGVRVIELHTRKVAFSVEPGP